MPNPLDTDIYVAIDDDILGPMCPADDLLAAQHRLLDFLIMRWWRL